MFHFAKYLYYTYETEKHMCFTKKSTRKVVNAGYCVWCSYNLRHFNCSIKLMKTLNSGLQITRNRAVSISYIFWNGPILEVQMQFYNLYGPIVSHRKREIGERDFPRLFVPLLRSTNSRSEAKKGRPKKCPERKPK